MRTVPWKDFGRTASFTTHGRPAVAAPPPRRDTWTPLPADTPRASIPPTAAHKASMAGRRWRGPIARCDARVRGSFAKVFSIMRDPIELTRPATVSYTHLRAHETPEHLVCRLLLE